MSTVKWVMGSDDGLRYSYDGSGWASGTGVTITTVRDVVHGLDANNNPIWVAVGTGNPSIQYSPNGKDWLPCTNAYFSGWGLCLLNANGMWLAGGYDPTTYKNILWSMDGMNWHNDIVFDIPNSNYCTIQSIGYNGNGVWLACGGPPNTDGNKNLWTSTNGTSWSSISTPDGSVVLNSIVYGSDSSSNPIWVLGQNTGTYPARWSPPGISWNGTTGITNINSIYKVLYTGTKWLVVGTPVSAGTLGIQTSPDGRAWDTTNWTAPLNETVVFMGVAYGTDSVGNPLYIAVGFNGTNNVFYSADGITWNTTQGGQPIIIGRSVAYASDIPPITTTTTAPTTTTTTASKSQPLWVAVGRDQSGNNIQWSSDPSGPWSDAPVFDGGSFGIAYGKDSAGKPIWVAVGSNTDGNNIQWSSDPSGIWIGAPVFEGAGLKIAYGKDSAGKPIWVAIGQDTGGYNIQWAPDPSGTWTGISVFGTGYCVAYGKDSAGSPVWVAGGSNTDGNTDGNNIQYASEPSGPWAGVPVFGGGGCYGIAYGKDSAGKPIWVAGGIDQSGNNIQYASDPSGSWTGVPVFGGGGCYDIAYGKDSAGKPLWVAGGNDTSGNNIQYASDPSGPWTGVPVFGGGDCYGIAYGKDSTGKSVWVAVGVDPSEYNIQWAFNPSGPWHGIQAFGTGQYYGFGIAFNRILGEDDNPPLPCFLQGTRILTPSGYKRIEEIDSGDRILTSDRRPVPVKIYRFTIEETTEESAPYCIHAGSLGDFLPSRDLHISGNHAIQGLNGSWQIPRFLANTNPQIQQHSLGERVIYYHVECPNYFRDNLIAEGVTAESYNYSKQPAVWKRTGAGYVRRKPIERNDWWVRPKK